jgi:hypothetical protein
MQCTREDFRSTNLQWLQICKEQHSNCWRPLPSRVLDVGISTKLMTGPVFEGESARMSFMLLGRRITAKNDQDTLKDRQTSILVNQLPKAFQAAVQ